MLTLDQALDSYESLSIDEQNIMADIIIRRNIESKREHLARKSEITMQEYRNGFYSPISATEAIEELRSYLKKEQ